MNSKLGGQQSEGEQWTHLNCRREKNVDFFPFLNEMKGGPTRRSTAGATLNVTAWYIGRRLEGGARRAGCLFPSIFSFAFGPAAREKLTGENKKDIEDIAVWKKTAEG